MLKQFEKRTIGVYFAIILLFVALMARVFAITGNEWISDVSAEQGRYILPVSTKRGDIYDSSGRLVVNTESENIIVLHLSIGDTPSDELVDFVKEQPNSDEIMAEIMTYKPVVIRTDSTTDIPEQSAVIKTYNRYSDNQIAPHIVGYVDSSMNGMTGIEAGFNSFLLQNTVNTSVAFTVDGIGTVFPGTGAEIINETQGEDLGIMLTIDKEIQQIAEKVAAEYLDSGAIVIADVKTGEIKASVSMPTYNPYDIEASLYDEGSPLINRAFYEYNVGSTFKLVVAAVALESGITSDHTHDCIGYTDIDGQIFRCNNLAGHGELSMQQAITVSCNPYFIELGIEVGYEAIYEMADALGFGKEQIFADGLSGNSGVLPIPSDVHVDAEVGNISFGQGRLMATPTQIAQAVAIIANGGTAPTLSLVKGICDKDGVLIESYRANSVITAMSEETAQFIIDSMIKVVEEGSGIKAQPEIGGAGGKTGSAQTGWIDEFGDEVVQAWFTGFFPADNPQYVISVLDEGGVYGSETSAPIFKKIVDEINKIK